MQIGVGPPTAQSEIRLECAYPGCNNKRALVAARALGRRFQLHFIGVSHSDFEEAPLTNSQGADLPPARVLNLQWRQLEYFAEDRTLGRVLVRLRETPASHGKVVSLGNPSVEARDLCLAAASEAPEAFFPAVNQNKLYMEIAVPRFGLTFTSEEPITNSAVVREIPPTSSEFQLEKPVQFKARRRWLPISMTLEDCRISMEILSGIEIAVGALERNGSRIAIPLTFTNHSESDEVTVGVIGQSNCGIRTSPDRIFVELDRDPLPFRIAADTSQAAGPGHLVVQVILAKPYTSVGHGNVVFDYDELVAA